MLARLLFAVLLAYLAGCAGFDLLTTFEISGWSRRLPWLTGYAWLGLGGLGGAIALLRPRGTKAATNGAEPRTREN